MSEWTNTYIYSGLNGHIHTLQQSDGVTLQHWSHSVESITLKGKFRKFSQKNILESTIGHASEAISN